MVSSLCASLIVLLAAPAARPGEHQVPLIRPGQAGTDAQLVQLARTAPAIIVGALVHQRRAVIGCQAAWQVELHTVAMAAGDPLERAPRAAVLAERPRAGCAKAPLAPFLRFGDVSLQAPAVLFLDTADVEVPGAEEVPFLPDYGFTLYGPQVLGAAPLDALPRVIAARAPNDGAKRLIVPLEPPAWRLAKTVATDPRTGLTWQRSPAKTPMRLADARAHCEALALGGHRDWRLPDLTEVLSLFEHAERFVGASPKVFASLGRDYFWTATDDDGAWVATLATGRIDSTHYDQPSRHGRYRALCVRRASPAAPVLLHRRLRVEGGLIVDPRSGRTWHRPTTPLLLTIDKATTYCRASRAGGFSDWRLPTLRESLTLAEHNPYVRPAPLFPTHPRRPSVWTRTRGAAYGNAGIFVQTGPRSHAHTLAPDADREAHNVRCVRRSPVEALRWTRPGDGDIQLRQPNGRPAIRGALRAGLRHGPWVFLDHRGRVTAQVNYAWGLAQGPAEHLYDEGEHVWRLTAEMQGGVRHGRVQTRTEAGDHTAVGRFEHGAFKHMIPKTAP